MNPFIPLKKANLAIVDKRIDQEMEDNLKRLGLEVIKTIKCEEVHESISYHPDIVIHPVNHNTLVIAPNVFDYYKDNLKNKGMNLIKGEKKLNCKYPNDIAYNVGRLSNLAIHNFEYTDEVLKYYLKQENLEFINVKQGYTKCSLSVVKDNVGITSDIPIYKELTELGCKILLIEPGNIFLESQNYGFIGGVNGNLSNYESVISGSLKDHPNEKDILDFFKKNKVKLNFLSDKKAVDIGTIITLYCH